MMAGTQRGASLKNKLSLVSGLLAALIVAIFGGSVSWHLKREINGNFNSALERRAAAILREASLHPAAAAGRPDLPPGIDSRAFSQEYVRIEHPPGKTMATWPGRDAPPEPLFGLGCAFADSRWHNHSLRWVAHADGDWRITLAADDYLVRESVEDVELAFLGATPVVLVVAVAGVAWVVRRPFAAIAGITRAAEQITAENLGERLPVPDTRDEFSKLATVFNGVFERLEKAFAQSARFAADASHQLRTPLALMRAEIEHAMDEPQLQSRGQRVLARLSGQADALVGITDSLLLLSRADAGKLLGEMVEVDFSRLLADLLDDLAILAETRKLALDLDLAEGARVPGDPALLRQLCYNLFDNAVKYNVEGGRVSVRLGRRGREVVLAVGNTANPAAPPMVPEFFARFARGRHPLARQVPGHGLGLSLCQAIARAHGGEIALAACAPGWSDLEFRLPACQPPGQVPR